MTKKLLTFILFAGGMFSFSLAEAQCVCLCTNNGQPRYNAECYTKSNGDIGCRNTRCRDGVADEQDMETFSLFINPADGSTSFTFPFYSGQAETVSLKIFDIKGELVSTLSGEYFEEGHNQINWNTEAVQSGIYFIQLQSSSYFENRKLIVMK